ncbi:MAG: HNH endonuclease, partial [Acidimicrobiia bacterium]|nr:HNH endonuclease [Acidimicrobiia bacterium]
PVSWCDAHHIKHWIDGGETSIENLVLICRHHHRKLHYDQQFEEDAKQQFIKHKEKHKNRHHEKQKHRNKYEHKHKYRQVS